MNIGIDITPLQGPHRMRGIGSVVINFINNLPKEAKTNNHYTFYCNDGETPLDLLNLEGLEYSVINRPNETELPNNSKRFRRISFVLDQFSRLRTYRRGDNRVKPKDGIDAFIQFDQLQSLPSFKNIKKVIVAYDLIPYILEAKYLISYKTARTKGDSPLAAFRYHLQRQFYIKRISINCRRANLVLAISENTKKDFVKYAGVKASKVQVVPLGTSIQAKDAKSSTKFNRYIPTSWGYTNRPYDFDNKTPYLLFVGGADDRRRLDHLVIAFNHLRARGIKLNLILAGDTMQGPKNIPTKNIQKALLSSSYLDDIVFMGFVTDEVREALYNQALAMVYPSMYEGFGLPILEAMKYGTPVITYDNSSIREVAEDAAMYANNYVDIIKNIIHLLDEPNLQKKYASLGKKQASKFPWDSFTEETLKLIA